MRLEKLSLQNFRNIGQMTLTPHPGVNVIYGENAQGKTNIIEAIYLLTGQKSFRQAREGDLVQLGCQEAVIAADFYGGGRSQTATLAFGSGRKNATLNELPVTPSELTGRFFAVVFSPAELALVQDGPALRRSFLDSAISQVMPRYLKTLAGMNRSLSQRNSLLADARSHPGLEGMLESWDVSFSKLSYGVINARRRYIARLAPQAAAIYSDITGGRESLTVAYQSSLVTDCETPREAEEAIVEQLRRSRGEDLRNGYTTLGPQRDDLELSIDGQAARVYGSQGQQRSCALALKLAECRLIEEICGEAPVILLDDVFSELDKSRRDYFIKGITQGQVFITSCEKTGLRGFSTGKKLRIAAGALQESRPRKKTAKPQKE